MIQKGSERPFSEPGAFSPARNNEDELIKKINRADIVSQPADDDMPDDEPEDIDDDFNSVTVNKANVIDAIEENQANDGQPNSPDLVDVPIDD